ncbi:MAG: hypothetical protein WC613_02200 [Candidatus Aenigmatarchaeota archaeon]
MYFKRRKRPHVQALPDVHEGYSMEIWNGNLRVDAPEFVRTFEDSEVCDVYRDAKNTYPKCEVLLFESVTQSRRKLNPVSPEQIRRRVRYSRKE